MTRTNDFGQPVGASMPDGWTPPPFPPHEPMEGMRVRLEPLDAACHGDDLYASNALDKGDGWTYLGFGPFADRAGFDEWLAGAASGTDPLYFAYIDKASGKAVGWGSYLRINPRDASIEVGSIKFSPLLQRTPLATEAMHLMMRNAFDLGYRRYEWKCDSLNAPSRSAALRLGFVYEGLFRQATHYKGRNRDTTWFSITDEEWPRVRAAHDAWLSPENFDGEGRQKRRLQDCFSPE